MPRGRPTKLTPEVRDKILQALRAGNYRDTAARWAGVTAGTLTRWMSQKGKLYDEFAQEVRRAETAAEIRMVGLVVKGAEDDVRHAQWWLERKFPDHWGRRDHVELTGKDGAPVIPLEALRAAFVRADVVDPPYEDDDERAAAVAGKSDYSHAD